MKFNDQTKQWWLADIGDYLKVIANGVVMLQPIISLCLTLNLTRQEQVFLASLYNLVKFTSPAFIFGIVFTVIRKYRHQRHLDYGKYYSNQWNNNFFPTIIWSLIYLIFMPNLQQHGHYTNILSFIWQLISGNGASHLWYSVMMLQFLIIMPIIKWVTNFVGHDQKRLVITVVILAIIYFLWLHFYDVFVLNGAYLKKWYLLDRFFVSFLIFGFYGGLAWNFHKEIQQFLFEYWWIVIVIYLLTYFWTTNKFISRHQLSNLTLDSYYVPSMAIYALAVIFLIYLVCIYQKVYKWYKTLKAIHFLAFYAYRAFLANVFWDQILWNLFYFKNLVMKNLYAGLIVIWLMTWILSYLSVYIAHQVWLKFKKVN